MFRKGPRKEPPVKEGEIYPVTIEAIGEKGDGIAKIKGYVIVVPKAQQGKSYNVKITAVRGKVSFGEVVGEAEAPESESMESEESESMESETGEEASEEEPMEESEEELSDEPMEESEEEMNEEPRDQ